MAEKLLKMNVKASTVAWILSYLTERPQYVRLQVDPASRRAVAWNSASRSDELISETIITNTGAPQGTVLSPFLFSLYTADCRTTIDTCTTDKFADDTALTGQITDDDDTDYRQEIDNFVDWCDDNYLHLNVDKTKEMIIDFRRNRAAPTPIIIKGAEIQQVETYKYLGVVVDNKLNWTHNTDAIMKKLNSRMHCLRKLNSFHVCPQLLSVFYSSVISSVLSFGLTCWGGNLTKRDTGRLNKVIRKAGGIIGRTQDDLDTLYDRRTTKKLTVILNDKTHPLRRDFDSLKQDRSNRFRLPVIKTNRYSNSFIPSVIRKHNEKVGRDECESESEWKQVLFSENM